MIFWTLLAISIVIVVGVFIVAASDGWNEWWEALAFAFLAAILCGVLGGGLLLLSLLIPGKKMTEETFPLRALTSSSTVQGRFYLGSGYVDGKRTLNYIAREDGYSRLGQGIADASRVYEDTAKPTVTEYTFWYSNGWVIPWEYVTGWAWDFHIPEGSILEDYTMTNE